MGLTPGTPVRELIRSYALSLEALTDRGVIRSNMVLADYAEWLAAKALGLTLAAGGSLAGYDAVDPRTGLTYQVKARRLSPGYLQPDLRGFGDLARSPFDRLIGVIVDADYQVVRAAVVPLEIVQARARGSRMYFGAGIVAVPGVTDVTAKFKRAADS